MPLIILPKKCPICRGDYDRIDQSEDVCKTHSKWFVVNCEVCRQVKFSPVVKICPHCLENCEPAVRRNGFSINHRVPLIQYGNEDWG